MLLACVWISMLARCELTVSNHATLLVVYLVPVYGRTTPSAPKSGKEYVSAMQSSLILGGDVLHIGRSIFY